MEARPHHAKRRRLETSEQEENCTLDAVTDSATSSASDDNDYLWVMIVSALYAPCEASDDDKTKNATVALDDAATVPLTRDVTPFLRALLIAQQQREMEADHHQQQSFTTFDSKTDTLPNDETTTSTPPSSSTSNTWIKLKAVVGAQRRVQIGLQSLNDDDQKDHRDNVPDGELDHSQHAGNDMSKIHHNNNSMGMNGIFGDPAPGMSKRLYIQYRIVSAQSSQLFTLHNRRFSSHAESHSASFAEHERVYLRAPTTTTTRQQKDRVNDPPDSFAPTSTISVASSNTTMDPSLTLPSLQSLNGQQHHHDFEVALPLIMPFLTLQERVQCRLVCIVWKSVIRDYGVAVAVDDADTTLYPHWNRRFLRGILSHSYASLQRLFLRSRTPDFMDASIDLHPALPHLRKLHTLDVSRCRRVDNATLLLLASCPAICATLQVLYLKSLPLVTDDGVVAIARSCRHLKVLDLSFLHALTDASMHEVGQHLVHLRAIYLRDNYRLTNSGIDVITNKCVALEQLTLWGCIRIQHLSFASGLSSNSTKSLSSSLVLLNLWGCHGLHDNAALALVNMTQLQTLIATECHLLTDDFVASITRYVPQLRHLHLRYCQLLTDAAVHAIAESMPYLYSLDLSFCTKITVPALVNLIELRGGGSLAELRLRACRNLDIAYDPTTQNGAMLSSRPDGRRGGRIQNRGSSVGGYAGRQLLAALRSHGDQCCLSILDVRQCSGHFYKSPFVLHDVFYRSTDPFVVGMAALSFEQKVGGYFARPARWNLDMERRFGDVHA